MDGAVHTYKACLVLKGFTQTPRIDYEETLSPGADIRGIRILISIAAFYDYEIWQMDIKISFLNGYLNEENLGEFHWSTLKNILKYLRNTKDMFLIYEGDTKRELRVSCYTDAGYLTDADDLNVFILNGGFVDWKSINQSIFATSSTDANYIATFDASKEAVWIRKFITRLGVVPTI
ncbi:putative retrotransposon protein [Tanacetum coccineum]|uniref:Retrotransposon protein n=1 Tax=Tanacetum coccineum TaxID=301880 RepID=A0ABQ5B0Z4_9ASTR